MGYFGGVVGSGGEEHRLATHNAPNPFFPERTLIPNDHQKYTRL